MQFLKIEFRKNKAWVIAGFLNWFLLLAFQTDRYFFSYDQVNLIMVVAKILSLFLIEFLWITAGRVYTAWKKGDEYAKRFVNIFFAYSLIICLFLLFLWPGTWSWDDLWILNAAQTYQLFPWQHFLSSFDQIVLLQLLPFVGGYVLIKNLFIAAIVAYAICNIEITFQLKPIFPKHYWLDIFFKLLPFLLPPVVLYQLSGYRIGLYVYLELLMFVVMLSSIKGTYKWSDFRIFAFSILLAVCICWRSESILYLLLGILFFAFSRNASFTVKKRVAGVVLVIFGSFSLMVLQNRQLGNDNYKLVSTLRQSVELIRIASPQDDAKDLATINKVVDINIIKAHPDHDGERVFWNDKAVKKYSKEEFNNYIKAVTHLALKYPSTFWKERWELFKDSTGLSQRGAVNNVAGAIAIYEQSENNKALLSLKTEHKYSLFPELRSKLLSIMGLEKNNKRIQPYHGILWNAIIPLIALSCFLITCLLRKEWQIALMTSFLIIKVPIVFFTAPSNWFMYFLSYYLLGYVVIDFFFVYMFGAEGKHKSHEK